MIRRALALGAALAVVAFAVMPAAGGKQAFAIGGCKDINGDAVVNHEDLSILVSYLGVFPAPAAADLNGDGFVTPGDQLSWFISGPGVVPCQATPVSHRLIDHQTYGFAGVADPGPLVPYAVTARYFNDGAYSSLVSLRPGLAAGSPADAFAADFAAAVTDFAVPGLGAVAVGPTLTVTLGAPMAAPRYGLLLQVNACVLTTTQSSCTFNPTISILSTGGVAEDPDLSALSGAVDETSAAPWREALGAGALAVLIVIAAAFVVFRRIGSRRVD
ncbi:MAG: hypothetical protein HY873_04290 [Chloroflexi bacterium]|nr:hypothetical protein [Chloroflexota bacterium]